MTAKKKQISAIADASEYSNLQCTHVAVLCVLPDCQQGKLTQKYKDNSEVCIPALPGIQHFVACY